MYVHNIAIKRRKKGPMQPSRSAVISPQEGIIGDCRGTGGLFKKRQITLLSLEQWRQACGELGINLPSWARRANICIGEHSFSSQDIGKIIYFPQSGVELEITGETTPCSRMDEVHPGLKSALKPSWRGGVTCRVIKGGVIHQDDIVEID